MTQSLLFVAQIKASFKKFRLYKNINAQFFKNMEIRRIELICIVVKYLICNGKLLSTEQLIT